jgi:hypothetical protein
MLNNPYVQNVASEFIALLLMALIGLAIYHITGRRRLLKFFNMTDSKNLCLYLSNLSIPSGGSLGVDGVPRSYSGPAIPLYEVHLVPGFQRLFNLLIPGIEGMPSFLKSLFLSDVTINAAASPATQKEVDRNTTLITVGSPGYNRASQRVETVFHALAKFVNDNSALQLGDVTPVTDSNCSFVQKAVDQATGQVAFYVAGPSSIGTTGAAFFLVTQWKQLDKCYPSHKPFCVMLRVTSQDARQHEVLFER